MPAKARQAPGLRKRRRRSVFWLVTLAVLAAAVAYRALTIEPRMAKSYLRDERPVILAHQGASGHAPSNTLEAFDLGIEQGGDIIELDVHLTKDGVVVVSHDETIDRMSNGSGKIKEMTLADLKNFDFGHDFSPDGGKSFPYRGKGVKIPTLEEVFVKYPGRRVNIEIKQAEPPMEKQVLALVRKHAMEDKILVSSFSTAVARRWAELAGERSATGASTGDMYEFVAYFLPHLDWLYQPKVDAFQIPVSSKLGPVVIRLDTPRLIDTAHRLGVKVHYWTINDEETMRRLLKLGADGLITDYPDRAMKVMKELGLH